MVARPAFDRLVAWLCAGEVGAVLCFEVSRLARTGAPGTTCWSAVAWPKPVSSTSTVFTTCRNNDRLQLGMKDSISEFELGVLRTRMFEAAGAKAHRGELRISVPIGYVWHSGDRTRHLIRTCVCKRRSG